MLMECLCTRVIRATISIKTTMHTNHFTLKVQSDVITETVATMMYTGDFRLKVQAYGKSKKKVTSTCYDDSWF